MQIEFIPSYWKECKKVYYACKALFFKLIFILQYFKNKSFIPIVVLYYFICVSNWLYKRSAVQGVNKRLYDQLFIDEIFFLQFVAFYRMMSR